MQACHSVADGITGWDDRRLHPPKSWRGRKVSQGLWDLSLALKREWESATQWWWRSSRAGRSDEVGVWLEGQEGRA